MKTETKMVQLAHKYYQTDLLKFYTDTTFILSEVDESLIVLICLLCNWSTHDKLEIHPLFRKETYKVGLNSVMINDMLFFSFIFSDLEPPRFDMYKKGDDSEVSKHGVVWTNRSSWASCLCSQTLDLISTHTFKA